MSSSHPITATCTLVGLLVMAGCGESPPAEAGSPPAATPPTATDGADRAPAQAATGSIETQDPPAAPPEASPAAPTSSTQMVADLTFNLLLEHVVTPAGLVRYDRLAADDELTRIGVAVKRYGEAPLPEDSAARLAFYCNVYNANAMFQALMERGKPGFTTVVDVEGFFDKRPIMVAGEPMTLNHLENECIRPMGDPRTHAALVCAAMSCPPLRQEIYRASTLDAQLDDQCRRWVNDTSKNRVEDGRLRISEIFKWYREDFQAAPYGGVVGFLRHYAGEGTDLAAFLEAHDDSEIDWLPYDWSLNNASSQQ